MQLTLGRAVLLLALLPALACTPRPTVSLGSDPDAGPSADAAAVFADAAAAVPDAALAGCNVSVSPSALDFCAIPGAAARLTVVAHNDGASPCTLLRAGFLGSTAFSTALATPATLAPGATLDIEVVYAATAFGDTADLTLVFDGQTVSVPMTGALANSPSGCSPPQPDAGVTPGPDASAPPDAGTPPDAAAAGCAVVIAPASLDMCGAMGARTVAQVTVANVGTAACPFTDAALLTTSGELLLLLNAPLPVNIAPGATLEVEVGYQPTDFVDDSASLSLTLDGARTDVPVTAHLGGPLGCP